jgi:hypothetical protein
MNRVLPWHSRLPERPCSLGQRCFVVSNLLTPRVRRPCARNQELQIAVISMAHAVQVLYGVNQRLQGEDVDSPLATIRPVKTVTVCCVTGDRGLCGGYNAFAIKKVCASARRPNSAQHGLHLARFRLGLGPAICPDGEAVPMLHCVDKRSIGSCKEVARTALHSFRVAAAAGTPSCPSDRLHHPATPRMSSHNAARAGREARRRAHRAGH